jgi:8-oxo-dGTP pyrophosphatase MutT (NUDIX family)
MDLLIKKTDNTNNYNYCNNCGKMGHVYSKCNTSITSIGIILFRNIKNEGVISREYLMIRRKDSLGYVDFMRGKYPMYNLNYLKNIINEMTINEKINLLGNDYKELWKNLWGDIISYQFKNEERISFDKFNQLKEGIIIKKDQITLEGLILGSDTKWKETEWGFPKGRREYREKDLGCALREFEEETGIKSNKINLIENLLPYEENFTGSNYKSYKHKYYIGFLDNNIEYNLDYDKKEVSDIGWMKIEEVLEKIRPYNLEKKELIKKIDKVLEEYRLLI